jgi:hypothetical protein
MMYPWAMIIANSLIGEMVVPACIPTKSVEQETADAIREILMSAAVLALKGAVFHPTAEGSAKCYEEYLRLQLEIVKADLGSALGEAK